MDYWISSDGAQQGPHSLQQLQFMWQHGQLTSNTYYYDGARAEWLLLRTLVESVHSLFTVEEAFVRLGQSRQRGCLTVSNQDQSIQLFVDGGFVVCATGDKEQGEFALSQALHLKDSTYEWFLDAEPPAPNLRLNISEYALKNSIARDIRVGQAASAPSSKLQTVSLPKIFNKAEVKLNFNYVLIPDDNPALNFRLAKITNVLGREDHCDVVVNDSQVSRKHCLLEVSEQKVTVKDLDSSNGTFVNGSPIQDGFLKAGDQLSLGSYKLVLHKERKRAPEMPD